MLFSNTHLFWRFAFDIHQRSKLLVVNFLKTGNTKTISGNKSRMGIIVSNIDSNERNIKQYFHEKNY